VLKLLSRPTVTEPTGRHHLMPRQHPRQRPTPQTTVLRLVRRLSEQDISRDYTDLRHRIINDRAASGLDTSWEWHVEHQLNDRMARQRVAQVLADEAAPLDLDAIFTVDAVAGL
jgi:hypothetical protein